MHARIFEIWRDEMNEGCSGTLPFRGWDIRSVETLSWRDAVNVAKKLSRLDLHGTMKKSKWISTPIVNFQDAYKLVWLAFWANQDATAYGQKIRNQLASAKERPHEREYFGYRCVGIRGTASAVSFRTAASSPRIIEAS